MMSTIKESLHSVIEQLDEEDALCVLKFTQNLKKEIIKSSLSEHLLADPAIKLPIIDYKGFRAVQPISGKGIPASEMLIKDRK